MGKNFLGLDGLKHFWANAKTWIIDKITTEVTAKIAEIVANAPEDLDTLKEIADWISAHANDAAAMNTQITANKNDITALKTSVAGKADTGHTHTKAQITDFPSSLKNPNALTINGKTYDGSSVVNAGVQTVANGGTGQTTANAAANSFINSLTTGESVPEDNDYYVAQFAGGGTTTTTYHRRPVSKLWEYIKGKADSIYAKLSHTHTKSQITDFAHTHDDRYFTETEVTNKLAGKSDVGHTHTKSEITDFPTSLPANGGTATKATQDGSGNVITSTYVKKSGDTLTSSTSDTPLYVNTTASGKTKSWIGFKIGSVSKNYIGADQNGLYSYTNSKNNKILDTSAQTLTDEEKTQVRSNIGAGTSSLTIGTTATTAAAGNHTHSGYLTAHQDISGKLNVDGSNATNTGTSVIVHSLDTATGDVTDDTEIITSNASGYSSSDTKYYKRAGSKVWNYIKSKISSVLGLTATNYGGKASTAGTADKTVNDITIIIPYAQESGQYVIPFGNILEPTSTEINSPYNWDITGFFSIIRPSGHNGSHIQFEAGHGYSHNWTTYAYLDKLEFRGVTTSIKAFQYEGKWWLGLCIITSNQSYSGKMTITFSRGLPATPTCILYNSASGGVANEEIYNSIQDIPSSWWKKRTICNPTTFNDKLYANGVITPRQGTTDGATVSIGRSDGNITIGDINNKNSGYTTINNDCKMLKSLNVSGDVPSNFEGGCNFDDISVHSKSLFPSGYIPRTYYIQSKTLSRLTKEDKALLKKLFAFMHEGRCIQIAGYLSCKYTTELNYPKFCNITGLGYIEYDGAFAIDDNDNITIGSDYTCNYCFLVGTDGDTGDFKNVDFYILAECILKDDWSLVYDFSINCLSFTLLEKV